LGRALLDEVVVVQRDALELERHVEDGIGGMPERLEDLVASLLP
jgi:hypothetical protein